MKAKVKLSLGSTEYHAMKMHWGIEAQLHSFSTPAPDGGEWPAPGPGAPPPGKESLVPIG